MNIPDMPVQATSGPAVKHFITVTAANVVPAALTGAVEASGLIEDPAGTTSADDSFGCTLYDEKHQADSQGGPRSTQRERLHDLRGDEEFLRDQKKVEDPLPHGSPRRDKDIFRRGGRSAGVRGGSSLHSYGKRAIALPVQGEWKGNGLHGIVFRLARSLARRPTPPPPWGAGGATSQRRRFGGWFSFRVTLSMPSISRNPISSVAANSRRRSLCCRTVLALSHMILLGGRQGSAVTYRSARSKESSSDLPLMPAHTTAAFPPAFASFADFPPPPRPPHPPRRTS